MSERRQHHTGSIWQTLCQRTGGFLICWFLPDIFLFFFPHLLIQSSQPWLLSPHDLTWKRSLLIMLMKPGFKIVFVAVAGAGYFIFHECGRFLGKRQLTFGSLRQSTEWVIDGARTGPLMDYVRWVEIRS